MKKTNVRQMIIGLLGSAMCAVNLMGCYPLAPAWFAALYLEDTSALLVTGVMYIGMMFFMPFTAIVKYGIVLLALIAAIRLVEWANEGCPAQIGAFLAAGTTMIMSFCGSLLEWKNQPAAFVVILEGVFIFGMVVILNRVFHIILGWRQTEKIVETPERINQEEKLLNYAESFLGLSKIFHSMSTERRQYTSDELVQIQSELTNRVCANCDSCAVCWDRDSQPLYGLLTQLVSSVFAGEFRNRNEESAEQATREWGQYCKKSRDMVEEAVHVFERVNLNHAWYNRLLENRQIIAEQLDAMAFIMQDCAREECLLDEKEKHALAEIRYRAKENGIVVEEIHLTGMVDGHIRLEARLRSRRGGCISLKTFLAAAGGALGCRMRAAAESKSFISKEAVSFVFYEDTLFRSVQGIARQKKDGAVISGDNFSFLELDRGELLLGLSDGMGSGSTACKESEMVLDLVERFLEVGFSIETAIRMMNSTMVMKGACDLYSTMDLCKVNLYNGMATLYKIGAAATFIRSGEKVECIRSENLPVGVNAQADIETHEVKLRSGDFIVMVTDGVLEDLHVPNPIETVTEMIESIETNNAGILAKKMMERIMLFTGGKVQDDMTILAASIWAKA